MILKSLTLAWFRGAGEALTFDTGKRSVVVYGPNGSGKSSLVDALEFLLTDGRIGHLAHEYSGKRYERSVPNTHMPVGLHGSVTLTMEDDVTASVEIRADGTTRFVGDVTAIRADWEFLRSALRQDDVADFIQGSKGEKYSALLPLLGLQGLESIAENLRQVNRRVEKEARLKEKVGELKSLDAGWRGSFGDDALDRIRERVDEVSLRNSGPVILPDGDIARCDAVLTAIKVLTDTLEPARRRHVALGTLGGKELAKKISAVREANSAAAKAGGPLLQECLDVLDAASKFGRGLTGASDIACPACGRLIGAEEFKSHVDRERQSLGKALELHGERKSAVAALARCIDEVQEALGSADLSTWRADDAVLVQARKCLSSIDGDTLRENCTEDSLKDLHESVSPAVGLAKTDSSEAPPGAKSLIADRGLVDAAKVAFRADGLRQELEAIRQLLAGLEAAEAAVRRTITENATAIIKELSEDIREIWGLLHPAHPIDNVGLYVPNDVEKSIDVGLRFHGVPQDSPRLTLSEGFRNSLGLSIFLAMARRGTRDCPLVLDDVVISFDREHRGAVAEVLKQKFADRQVILLTHDRDWAQELKHILDASQWEFRRLAEFESPKVGIQWTDRGLGLEEAKALVTARPDQAVTEARKFMDRALARIAEKLQLRMSFRRGEKNDIRMSHEFLAALIEAGERCFVKKGANAMEPNAEALNSLRDADTLLLAWGNRGAHSEDVAQVEAVKVVAACEKAYSVFNCTLPTCRKAVWALHSDDKKLFQCGCGNLQWKAGKA